MNFESNAGTHLLSAESSNVFKQGLFSDPRAKRPDNKLTHLNWKLPELGRELHTVYNQDDNPKHTTDVVHRC